jgi:hypothetical protein
MVALYGAARLLVAFFRRLVALFVMELSCENQPKRSWS